MGSVLNTLHHFFMPAFAPVVMNICWILGAVLAPYTGKTLEKMIYAVAIATFLSGLVQVIIHIPVLRRKELYYRPVLQFSDPGLKLVLTRIDPVVFGLAVVQINVLIDSIIAVDLLPLRAGLAISILQEWPSIINESWRRVCAVLQRSIDTIPFRCFWYCHGHSRIPPLFNPCGT